ncbi:hemolysin transporter protein shlB, partial [Yersinia pestis PY-06]
MIRKRTALWLF